MGLLTVGQPLNWTDTAARAEYIRKHGIVQFLNLYTKLKQRESDFLKWGDEIEYMLVKFDQNRRVCRLKLGGEDIVAELNKEEIAANAAGTSVDCLWRPEFASYMVEGTPGRPYGGMLAHFNLVEKNMRMRRQQITNYVNDPDIKLMSLTVYPRLGCGPAFTEPEIPIDDQLHQRDGQSKTRSIFFPDEVVNKHPRFLTLANNVRSRRGRKVEIQVPIYRDVNTPKPFRDPFVAQSSNADSLENGTKDDMIYMDAMGFGMGNSCLQMTFQGTDINEARYLYDQLTPLTPIVMALSAAAPIYRGYLSDIDCRWKVISASVDDRKPEEMDKIRKSRYDSIDLYLHESSQKFNDTKDKVKINKEVFETLTEAGIDEILARHLAHLWIRDPISVFEGKIELDDEKSSDHFENIQSTNWQTMRFKPPPPNSDIGWRVEFRPTEIQISDFENAAIVCFLVLTTRAILAHQLKLVIPISQVDENMQTAHKRDAVNTEKFYFRTNLKTTEADCPEAAIEQACIRELSINEIINGKCCQLCASTSETPRCNTMDKCGPECTYFRGIVPILESYISDLDVDLTTGCRLMGYLNFISKRASGEYKTTAKWIREFVHSHPDYKKDSVISEGINYDLLAKLDEIATGKDQNHRLFEQPDNVDEVDSFKLTPGTRRVYGPSVSER